MKTGIGSLPPRGYVVTVLVTINGVTPLPLGFYAWDVVGGFLVGATLELVRRMGFTTTGLAFISWGKLV